MVFIGWEKPKFASEGHPGLLVCGLLITGRQFFFFLVVFFLKVSSLPQSLESPRNSPKLPGG